MKYELNENVMTEQSTLIVKSEIDESLLRVTEEDPSITSIDLNVREGWRASLNDVAILNKIGNQISDLSISVRDADDLEFINDLPKSIKSLYLRATGGNVADIKFGTLSGVERLRVWKISRSYGKLLLPRLNSLHILGNYDVTGEIQLESLTDMVCLSFTGMAGLRAISLPKLEKCKELIIKDAMKLSDLNLPASFIDGNERVGRVVLSDVPKVLAHEVAKLKPKVAVIWGRNIFKTENEALECFPNSELHWGG